MLNPAALAELMESSDVVGNIRFSHPTLYVFPGGQGDAALFGINGFNMLGNGNRKYPIFSSLFYHFYLILSAQNALPLHPNYNHFI